MNSSIQRTSTWLRLCLNTGFVLVLVSSAFAKAAVTQGELFDGKAMQQAFSEAKFTATWLDSDPPESRATLALPEPLLVLPAPRVLGFVQPQQHASMVHQLRDRLMHAPPVVL